MSTSSTIDPSSAPPARMPRGQAAVSELATPRLLRLPQVIEITGLGRDTIYRYIRDGSFPRQRRISARASAWREDEIRQWVESRPVVGRAESKGSRV